MKGSKTDEKSTLGPGAEGPHISTLESSSVSGAMANTVVRGLASEGTGAREPNGQRHQGRLGALPSSIYPRRAPFRRGTEYFPS